MLTHLTIKNFGLIEHVSIDFSRGLNIFTGATGAGKSILIDALRFCLGERLNAGQVRDASLACQAEAIFELSPAVLAECPGLAEFVGEEKNQFIFQRAFLPDGRTRIKINGLSVTVSQLRDIGDHLVDFHGPHDHQMLLSEQSHRQILDRLSGNIDLLSEYSCRFREFQETRRQLDELNELRSARDRELEYLTHQIKELEQVPLDDAHYETLLQRRTQLINAEKLHELSSQLLSLLDNDETGIAKQLRQAFSAAKPLTALDPATAAWADILSRIQDDTTGLRSELQAYQDQLAFDEHTSAQINQEYDLYYEILRKYGPTLEQVRRTQSDAQSRYATLSHIEESDAQLRKQLSSQQKELESLARTLSSGRIKTAKKLRATIEQELKELGMAHIRFECRIDPTDLHAQGADTVTFFISPNAGETLKPLADIVSSGEAARVMLALKKALTLVDPIPVLLFDEIDAQIGGRLGTVTGQKLRELAHNRQVMVITHLAQIASFAEAHFKVEKTVSNKRTLTTVALLNAAERAQELAKMMSGEQHTTIALEHAQELLAKATKSHKGTRAQGHTTQV